ncbi:MAG: hypothetical protein WCE21_04625 [Candidatus Babeliales bacterium]
MKKYGVLGLLVILNAWGMHVMGAECPTNLQEEPGMVYLQNEYGEPFLVSEQQLQSIPTLHTVYQHTGLGRTAPIFTTVSDLEWKEQFPNITIYHPSTHEIKHLPKAHAPSSIQQTERELFFKNLQTEPEFLSKNLPEQKGVVYLQNTDESKPFTITEQQLYLIPRLNQLYEDQKATGLGSTSPIYTGLPHYQWNSYILPILSLFSKNASLGEISSYITTQFPNIAQKQELLEITKQLEMSSITAVVTSLLINSNEGVKTKDDHLISIDPKIINSNYLGNIITQSIIENQTIPVTLTEWKTYVTPFSQLASDQDLNTTKVQDLITKAYTSDSALSNLINFAEKWQIPLLLNNAIDVAAKKITTNKEKYKNNDSSFALSESAKSLLISRIRMNHYIYTKTSTINTGFIHQLTFSPVNDNQLIAASKNNISSWSTKPPFTQKNLLSLPSESKTTIVRMVVDTKYIAAALTNGTVKAWGSSDFIKDIDHLLSEPQQSTIALTKGRIYAAQLSRNTIDVINAKKDPIDRWNIAQDSIQTIHLNHTATHVAAISKEKNLSLEIRDINQKLLYTVSDPATAQAEQVCFSYDDSNLISSSYDGTITVFSLMNKPHKIMQFKTKLPHPIITLPPAANNSTILCAWGNVLQIWDFQKGTLLHTITLPHENIIYAMAINSNNSTIAIATNDSVQLWESPIKRQGQSISSLLKAISAHNEGGIGKDALPERHNNTVIEYLKAWLWRKNT